MLSQSRFVLEIVNQASFYACVLREISVPTELALGHLRCRVTDMPPQPNSPSGRCLETRLRHHRSDAVGSVKTMVGYPRVMSSDSDEAALRGGGVAAVKSQTKTVQSPKTLPNPLVSSFDK